jgi:hypothetical protein
VSIGDLVGNGAQTPLVVVIASGLLAIAGFIGKRAAASMARQGARVGRLEIVAAAEQTRRRQLEQCLREFGFPLPYWDGDPPELYLTPARPARSYDDDVDERPETATTEAYRPPVPTRHRTH